MMLSLGLRVARKETKKKAAMSLATTPIDILFVWDFDWTVVNCNSDEYIPAQFFPNDDALHAVFRKIYQAHEHDWHACVMGVVDVAMQEYGATPETIETAARHMPYLTGVRQALDVIHAHRPGNDNEKPLSPKKTGQMILSDGNTLFIGEFIKANGLSKHFDCGVVTNTGQWVQPRSNSHDDEQDNPDNCRLAVVHQSQQYGGHDCPDCPANLCKTQALTRVLEDMFSNTATNTDEGNKDRPRIVYVGDGANDACPARRVLGAQDFLLARVGQKRKWPNARKGPETDEQAMVGQELGSAFGIMPALQRAGQDTPQCTVWEWHIGEELRQLVEKVLEETS